MTGRITRRGALALGAAAGAGLGVTSLAGPAAAATPTKTFAPLPLDAKPRPVPAEGYILDRIGTSMHAVTANGNQTSFVVTRAGVVLIDAPPSLAAQLPAAIRRVTTKPVTHIIYTHSHADHIANAFAFGDVIRVAHEDTAAILRASRDPNRPLPTVTFRDTRTLHVGGERFELSYPGPNHEAGNIIIHVPGQRAAVMCDVVLPGWSPFKAWGTADSVPGVLRAHDVLARLDIDTFVGGHVHRLGTPADIRASRDFTYDLWHTTARAVARIPLAAYASQAEPGNQWALFQLYYDAVADAVEPEIISRWSATLGGVDVFTRDNVVTIAVSLLLDAPRDIH
ncbi:MBL fold metallo-hydrolase [Kutzneria sp. 744]|uniref:MBL fold metallo-hydrolase n=1 Tax=Kutzneria sp. (strain 744) TaxID=345341 RepID=UPI0003EEB09A|nr:MBL fold metallo-hydrolase [Kutzneria sp. 744]EWM11938.1 beta-lactamase [Kutzneria sp. 744]